MYTHMLALTSPALVPQHMYASTLTLTSPALMPLLCSPLGKIQLASGSLVPKCAFLTDRNCALMVLYYRYR
jgi:hypothetical protein